MKHKTILTLVLMVSGLFFLNSSLFGAEQFFKGKPTLPGKPYGVLLLSEWSKQEKWVWKQICEGKQANLAEYSGGAEDPKTKKGWKKNQKLSSKFLETILLYEPYISSLTHKGIHISGAWFVEMIDLQNANINYEIRIELSRFDETVDLFAVKTSSLISFNNSSFYKNLNLESARISTHLFLQNGRFKSVNLQYAKIDNAAVLDKSEFSGLLNGSGMEVGGNLNMRSAKFWGVRLFGARIGGMLYMTSSEFIGLLNMNAMQVSGSLLMSQNAKFHHTILLGAKIEGQIQMNTSEFSGLLNMDEIKVGGNLNMRHGAKFAGASLAGAEVGGEIDMTGSEFSQILDMYSVNVGRAIIMVGGTKLKAPVRLSYSKIGSSLFIHNTTLASIDLTGTIIGKDLSLSSSSQPFSTHFTKATWLKNAKLTLRNAEVATLIDRPEAWPDEIELEGFVYKSIFDIGNREVSDFKKWLDKSDYSSQPYKHLASILRTTGRTNMANEILYIMKERERLLSKGAERFWLNVQRLVIGYGYHNFRALYCLIGFIVLGWLFIRRNRQGRIRSPLWQLIYSLDMLLPIIELDSRNYMIFLSGEAKYYFYIHKLAGYILVFFLIAGLSGITK